MQELNRRLSSLPDVDTVRINEQTGSVLLLGKPTARLEEVASSLVEVVEQAGPEQAPEVVAVELVKQIDGGLRRASGGRLSLRWVVPAAFVGLGFRQLLVQGFAVGALPWYVLLYYGVDSFLKMYPELAPKPHGDGSGRQRPEGR
jgi:hypothetical protein